MGSLISLAVFNQLMAGYLSSGLCGPLSEVVRQLSAQSFPMAVFLGMGPMGLECAGN